MNVQDGDGHPPSARKADRAKARSGKTCFYRLNVFTIFAPPLRERKPDIMLLADHFVEKYSNEHGKSIKRISTPAIDMLTSYHWPGNVRELENTIERAVLVCDGAVIHAHHLPPTLQTAEASDTVSRVALGEAVQAFEKDLVLDALEVDARQLRSCREASVYHRAHPELQSPQVRDRHGAISLGTHRDTWTQGHRDIGT